MTLIKTVVAYCDGKIANNGSWHHGHLGHEVPCGARVSLGSRSTQPYLDLIDIGWSNEVVGEDMQNFCPGCTRRRAAQRASLDTPQEASTDA